MRLLMLSSDSKIFDEGSRVAARMAGYGALVSELTIVVVAAGVPREKMLAPNVRASMPGGEGKVSIFLNARRALQNITATAAFDLVSAQDPFFIGMLGHGISRKRGIPLQVQLHTDCFSYGFLTESPRRIAEALMATFVLRRAGCIRVVSERIAQSVRKITRVPVTVLPIHIPYTPHVGFTKSHMNASEKDSILEKDSHSHQNLKIVSVSRLTREKRIHLIIDAVAITPHVELTVVGDGPLRKSLESRVQSLGLGERVRFVGWQDPLRYYQQADVFVQASRYEGYGVALIEAALQGLAIITTDVGIVGEAVQNEESALVVSGKSGEIARAMRRLVEEPDLRMRLGQKAEESAQSRTLTLPEYLTRYKRTLETCGE